MNSLTLAYRRDRLLGHSLQLPIPVPRRSPVVVPVDVEVYHGQINLNQLRF